MLTSTRQAASRAGTAPTAPPKVAVASQQRRQVLLAGVLSAIAMVPAPALAYGGQKQLAAMDAASQKGATSSGNLDYDELAEIVKRRGGLKAMPTVPEAAEAAPTKGRRGCATGKEPGCNK